MKRKYFSGALPACAAMLLTCLANLALASDKLNFSGKYIVEPAKNTLGGESDSTLEIVQNDDRIEITRLELGKKTISRCTLNGLEGDYTSPSGVSGKCKAQLKPKYLIVESVVATRPQQTSPPVRMHTKEKWQLSSDAKTLSIKSEVDFPDFSPEISAAVAPSTSGTTKYRRAGP